MPIYEVTDPKTNKTLEFDGDAPPSEAIIKAAFGIANKQDKATSLGAEVPGLDKELSWQQDSPVKRTISGLVRGTLKGGGAVLGGLLGAPVGPAGGVGGGMLGYTAGAQASDLFDNLLYGKIPQATLIQRMSALGGDLTEGAVNELIPLMPKIMKNQATRIFNIKPENLDYASKARKQLLDEYGIKYNKADITQKSGLQQLESSFGHNIESATIRQQASQKKLDSVNKAAQKIQEDFGGGLDNLTAGRVAKDIAKENEQSWRKVVDEVYADIEKALPDGTLIPQPRTQQVVNEMAEELAQGKISGGNVLSILDRLKEPNALFRAKTTKTDVQSVVDWKGNPVKISQDKVTPSDVIGYAPQTYRGMENDIRALGSLASVAEKQGNKADMARYLKLKTSLQQDMDDFFTNEGGDIAEKYSFAKLVHDSGRGVFRGQQIANALIEQGSPEKIIQTFIFPNNATKIANLREALGPEGIQPIKQAWFRGLITKGEEQSLSLAKYASAIEQYKDKDLLAFLTPKEFTKVKDLAKIARIMEKTEKYSGNASGTSRITAAGNFVAGMFTHPVMTSLKVIGRRQLAQLYFENPQFSTLVNAGLKMNGQSESAKALAARLLNIAGIEVKDTLSGTLNNPEGDTP